MKLVVVTQDAPIYLPAFLDRAFASLTARGHRVEGVVALRPTFKNTWAQEIRSRLAYYGAVDFLRMAAYIARHKLLARLAPLFPAVGCHSVANVLARHGVERLPVSSVNDAEFHELLKRREVDLVLSIAATQIFRKKLLATPRLGCLNYHMGMLPRYRGRQPLFWALYHGEPNVGLTVHQMDSELDNGPIVVQTSVAVDPEDSLHRLYLKCLARGPELIAQAVDLLERCDAERIPNDRNAASYFSFPTAEDARQYRAGGHRFF